MAKKRTHSTHHESHAHEIDAKRLGMTFGILAAAYMLLLGLAAWLLNWGSAIVHTLRSLYVGFEPSFGGIILGVFWGFVDGFVGGFMFGVIYNKLGRCKWFKK